MYELINDKTLAEYEAFLQQHPKGHFAQSSLWAKQKPMWAWNAVAVRGEDGKIKGSLALMSRKVPGIGRTLLYGCRGPVCDLRDRETFAELLEGAKALAKQQKAYVIKIDPDVPSSDTAFAEMMRSFGFRCKEGGKNFEAIQPRYVFRLNVEGKTEDELMAAFHQKWRYNIRLAERKGVTVKICGKEMVPAFADLMLTTGVRDGFVTRQPEYFANMLDNLGEHARLYMAFDPEGTPIAGTLAIHYGDKVWYLYGASSNEHRNLMPNYLLQWRMIQWAVETGCRLYDFRGSPATCRRIIRSTVCSASSRASAGRSPSSSARRIWSSPRSSTGPWSTARRSSRTCARPSISSKTAEKSKTGGAA